MARLTVDELRRRREDAVRAFSLEASGTRGKIVVHLGTCGIAAGALDVVAAVLIELQRAGMVDDISFTTSGCAGHCAREPMMTVSLAHAVPVTYADLTPERACRILTEHVAGGTIVAEYALGPGMEPGRPALSFFSRQLPLVFRNRGIIDPERIDDALATGGYAALELTLASLSPEEVIDRITRSGLRGRGGGGFPTGLKWSVCRREAKAPKYIVGNCDEGDPGAYMDRSLVESDPHAVIEGMAIGAYAIGASRGYVYVRTEYALALERLQTAIDQARELGLLGPDILESGFDFDVEIRAGSGAFVCGEETSLIRSIQGDVPEPRPRPPFPAQAGLWGCPTVVNNVETLATVPLIVARGPEWYSAIGTATSKGTKIFSLFGKVNNTGLIEVPMGTTLREIVYEIGDGIPGGKRLKAVQVGGPSGGCLPADLLDMPIDYETLAESGSMMGSASLVVMDEDTCVVDMSKFFVQFTNEESCGRCSVCREGSGALLEVLTRISNGEGREGDVEFLGELASAVKDASMCGLGQTLSNPVLSTLRYFKQEYERHIVDGDCPAKVCRPLIKYFIDPDRCPGCLLCLKNCPAGAIRGSLRHVHVIDQTTCTKCGECLDVCPPKVSAVVKLSGRAARELESLPEPVPVKAWKARRAEMAGAAPLARTNSSDHADRHD